MKRMRLIDIWHLGAYHPGRGRDWCTPKVGRGGPGQARPRRAGTGLGEGRLAKDQLVAAALADPGPLYRYWASV